MSNPNLLTELPLFSMLVAGRCERCFDTCMWLTPRNIIETCPRVQMREAHAEANSSAYMVRRAVVRLSEQQFWINSQLFDLARILTNFTSKNPCPRQEIFDHFFDDTNLTYPNKLRKVHALIEDLRKVWLLPVGSRKDDPSGYWIITEMEDFQVWFDRVKAAPITQLTTIHRVAKHNFPLFAEQMELDFFKDFGNGE